MPNSEQQNTTTGATTLTATEFIDQLPASIEAENDVDADLTAILATHTIKENPDVDAALSAIIDLAETRAEAPTLPEEPEESNADA